MLKCIDWLQFTHHCFSFQYCVPSIHFSRQQIVKVLSVFIIVKVSWLGLTAWCLDERSPTLQLKARLAGSFPKWGKASHTSECIGTLIIGFNRIGEPRQCHSRCRSCGVKRLSDWEERRQKDSASFEAPRQGERSWSCACKYVLEIGLSVQTWIPAHNFQKYLTSVGLPSAFHFHQEP